MKTWGEERRRVVEILSAQIRFAIQESREVFEDYYIIQNSTNYYKFEDLLGSPCITAEIGRYDYLIGISSKEDESKIQRFLKSFREAVELRIGE